MNKNVVLSIMVGSALVVSALTPAVAQSNGGGANKGSASKIDTKKPKKSSGKCASGKCGTEKIYSKVSLSYDPQGQLVVARDGKCGLSGLGINSKESPQKIAKSKVVGGVCGK